MGERRYMSKADLSYIFTREDLEPEIALEVARQATSPEEMRHILVNLAYYFRNAISKVNADDKTKAEAIFHIGEFVDAFFLATEASPTLMARFFSTTEERLYSFLKDYLVEFAHIYVDLKNGKPLKDVKDRLSSLAHSIHIIVEYYIDFANLTLRDLFKERHSLTANA
jgi:hypothetical protein